MTNTSGKTYRVSCMRDGPSTACWLMFQQQQDRGPARTLQQVPSVSILHHQVLLPVLVCVLTCCMLC